VTRARTPIPTATAEVYGGALVALQRKHRDLLRRRLAKRGYDAEKVRRMVEAAQEHGRSRERRLHEIKKTQDALEREHDAQIKIHKRLHDLFGEPACSSRKACTSRVRELRWHGRLCALLRERYRNEKERLQNERWLFRSYPDGENNLGDFVAELHDEGGLTFREAAFLRNWNPTSGAPFTKDQLDAAAKAMKAAYHARLEKFHRTMTKLRSAFTARATGKARTRVAARNSPRTRDG
jgi:hypothetical protein